MTQSSIRFIFKVLLEIRKLHQKLILANYHISLYKSIIVNRFEYCDIPKCTEDEIEQMGLCSDVDCGTGGNCYLNKWVFKRVFKRVKDNDMIALEVRCLPLEWTCSLGWGVEGDR